MPKVCQYVWKTTEKRGQQCGRRILAKGESYCYQHKPIVKKELENASTLSPKAQVRLESEIPSLTESSESDKVNASLPIARVKQENEFIQLENSKSIEKPPKKPKKQIRKISLSSSSHSSLSYSSSLSSDSSD